MRGAGVGTLALYIPAPRAWLISMFRYFIKRLFPVTDRPSGSVDVYLDQRRAGHHHDRKRRAVLPRRPRTQSYVSLLMGTKALNHPSSYKPRIARRIFSGVTSDKTTKPGSLR